VIDLAKMIVEKRQAEKRQAKRRQAKEWQAKEWRAIIRYMENEPVLLRDILPEVLMALSFRRYPCSADRFLDLNQLEAPILRFQLKNSDVTFRRPNRSIVALAEP